MQQPRVVAHEATDERAARQPREVAVLQRFDLPRRELELLCDRVEREPGGLARMAKQHTGGFRLHLRRQCVGRHRFARSACSYSHAAVASAFVSAASGYRLRSCDTYESSDWWSPSFFSMHMPR